MKLRRGVLRIFAGSQTTERHGGHAARRGQRKTASLLRGQGGQKRDGLWGSFAATTSLWRTKADLCLMFLYAIYTTRTELPLPNAIELHGFLCKPPVFRTTPFNREICDILFGCEPRLQQERLHTRNRMGTQREVRQISVGGRGDRDNGQTSKQGVSEENFRGGSRYQGGLRGVDKQNRRHRRRVQGGRLQPPFRAPEAKHATAWSAAAWK